MFQGIDGISHLNSAHMILFPSSFRGLLSSVGSTRPWSSSSEIGVATGISCSDLRREGGFVGYSAIREEWLGTGVCWGSVRRQFMGLDPRCGYPAHAPSGNAKGLKAKAGPSAPLKNASLRVTGFFEAALSNLLFAIAERSTLRAAGSWDRRRGRGGQWPRVCPG